MEIALKAASAVVFYIFPVLMFRKLYERKSISIFLELLGIVIASIIAVILGLFDEPIINFAYSFFSFLVINKLYYKCSEKAFIVYDLILLIIMMGIEMLSVAVLSAIISVEIATILTEVGYTMAAQVLNWLLLFLAFRIYIYFAEKTKITCIKTHELLFFLLLTGGEVFLLHYLNEFLTKSTSHYELSILLFIFLSLDIYVAYLFYKISDAYQLEAKLSLVTQQSALQLRAYKDLADKYALSRQTIHDVKRHISTMQNLIDKNQLETAEKYTGMMNDELDKLTPEFMCDNEILSVIINSKLTQAKQLKVKFTLDIQYSLLDFISEMDVTAIFANLLDNAFEACQECDEQDRFVRLSVLRHNDFLLIYVKNSFKQVDEITKGIYKTTKTGHQGIGLTNVKNVVEKYGGIFNTCIENMNFLSEITLCIPS